MSNEKIVLEFNNDYLKKHKCTKRYKFIPDEEWIMSTVADSDVKAPVYLREVLHQIADNGVWSYVDQEHEFKQALIEYLWKHHNYHVNEKEILIGNGIIHLMNVCLHAFTKKGDGVILPTPAYNSFIVNFAESASDRKLIFSPMVFDEKINNFRYDFKLLEEQFKDPNNKIFIHCSPHNPTGRVWTKEETRKLIDLAIKYDVLIFSDEIWSRFCFDQTKFHTIFSADTRAADCAFVFCSALKNWNIGGLQHGYMICLNNEKILKVYHSIGKNIMHNSTNPLTLPLLIEGYKNPQCHQWFLLFKKMIHDNWNYFYDEITKKTKIKILSNEANFVCFADFSAIEKDPHNLNKRFVKIKIDSTLGEKHGEPYSLWRRFNFSLEPKVLKEMTRRIVEEFK